MTQIVFLLTTTPWNDRRQYHREAPALLNNGNQITYVAGRPDQDVVYPYDYVSLSALQRRRARMTGALNLFRLIRSRRPDVIQICSVEQLPLGISLKAFTGIRVVYDCREDMAPAMLRHRDNWPPPVRWLMYWTTRALEGAASRWFDGMVTADPAVLEKHSSMPPERKMVFFNAAPMRHFPETYPALAEREFDLVVMGSMTPRSGVLDAVRAVGEQARQGREYRLMLLGEPDKFVMPAINEAVAQYGIEHLVTKTGKVPHEEITQYLTRCKVGLVPLRDFPKFRSNIACKAFEYMACGMPTIASDLPPQRIFLEDNANGLFYPPEDYRKLAVTMDRVLSDPQALEEMGRQARLDVENKWNAERFEAELADFYDELMVLPKRRLLAG